MFYGWLPLDIVSHLCTADPPTVDSHQLMLPIAVPDSEGPPTVTLAGATSATKSRACTQHIRGYLLLKGYIMPWVTHIQCVIKFHSSLTEASSTFRVSNHLKINFS